MKIPVELSERISILRFPLIVGVVFLHAYDPSISKSVHLQYVGWVRFIFDYISAGLATLSVPLLFLLSGYLFFWGFQASAAGFMQRIVKRGRTLLIPLLFWNLFFLLLMAIAQATPAVKYFSGRLEPIASFTALNYLNALLGLTTRPIAYQFWFVRDLLVLVLLSPLVYFLVTKAPIPLLLLLGYRWFSPIPSWTFLTREAALFFCIGSLLALRGVDLRTIDRWALLLTLAYVPISVLDAATKNTSVNNAIHKPAELLGVAFVLCASKYIWQFPTLKKYLLALSVASFFVFAAHEPLLTAVRRFSYAIWTPSTSTTLLLYFADPLLVVAFCTALYYVLRSTMPAFTGVVTGGRAGMAPPKLLLNIAESAESRP